MSLYPNQRYRPLSHDKAKHLGDRVLGDRRLQAARENARKLRGAVDGGKRKLKKLLDELEHLKHERHEEEHQMESVEKIDHLMHELEKLAHETHTEIAHSPSRGMFEYGQGEHVGPEAGLFQLVTMFLLVLKHFRALRAHTRRSLEAGAAAKRVLHDVKTAAKRR